MQTPMPATLVRQREAIAALLRRMLLGVETFVDHDSRLPRRISRRRCRITSGSRGTRTVDGSSNSKRSLKCSRQGPRSGSAPVSRPLVSLQIGPANPQRRARSFVGKVRHELEHHPFIPSASVEPPSRLSFFLARWPPGQAGPCRLRSILSRPAENLPIDRRPLYDIRNVRRPAARSATIRRHPIR